MSVKLHLVTLFVVLLLSGCANLGVEPWERNILAKPEMQLIEDPVSSGLDDHIYFSKEASSGGRGFAGGGCGCN
ncbi:MAG: DUF4266 domain-containing protein [Candidatus Thiodiazotropha lotti]|uniref:DUF4266 domain-containing protein n=1 Tax=Candidatus Thiodiazotropha endoloripes TaxID=1818881 RepID=A0A1E2UN20_9GAMM|nr:DUF4266 domain-containing protein [Candidatus Thiodiazotropha endoloripes]MCG7898077.1 DUF4266 domain-containing protein [Candidatus Thiodiazotropha weberae]MCG7991398.1 DUF4266 domain-containing protein [Candidatus Thiodiazotropha lotti]MCG7902908.1 DUF4266 domain-containing protein [Candidatus Thiodiazotropha weberae]MCG7912589.1 DUF4266 domain-containing protein [Candidatus Thiodiazotropha weberae]MCG8001110.1 DUF4266 domain-containing protein [Candidatus Thiodiazotropha lotti]